MKSKLPVIAIAAVAAAIIAAAAIFFTSSPYTGYSSAFSKTSKINGAEYNTSAQITVDGKTTTATGNFKIRDISTKVNFVNVMSIGGTTVTQFTDGETIYVDDGQTKTKFKIGEKQQQTQKAAGEFSIDNYVQEFSGLLDASKIKDLKIVDKLDQRIIEKITKKSVNGSTQYDVTLASALVSDIFKSIVSSEGQGGVNPDCVLRSFSYSATANASNYIENIAYTVDMDVTFPAALTGNAGDETKSVHLELAMDAVNPGAPASFSLPATDGF
jgi:hypothetical protein